MTNQHAFENKNSKTKIVEKVWTLNIKISKAEARGYYPVYILLARLQIMTELNHQDKYLCPDQYQYFIGPLLLVCHLVCLNDFIAPVPLPQTIF